MIFHASIAVNTPSHVADVIAELWGGEKFPFGLGTDSWIVAAGDDRGTIIEVYPLGHLIRLDGQPRDKQASATLPAESATHIAMGTVLSRDEVIAIGTREGWAVREKRRAGGFDVIELWLENSVMLELLPADKQEEYKLANSIASWSRLTEKRIASATSKTTS